jgi:hypothetical protein
MQHIAEIIALINTILNLAVTMIDIKSREHEFSRSQSEEDKHADHSTTQSEELPEKR